MKAEVVSIGTELLMGEITDTNSSYLASKLPPLGIELRWTSGVGDNMGQLVEVLKRAWERSELILTTGGLGPTDDDLTREAIAEMLGEKMEVIPQLEKDLRERFARWKMNMPTSNLKQATLIPSAKAVPNDRGTAPGWWVEKDGRILVCMPGPPAELEGMWTNEVQPKLKQKAKSVILSRTFKTFGLSEAAVGELVSPYMAIANPFLGVYAKADGIHLRFIASAERQQSAEKMLSEGEANVRRLLGEYIWGVDNDTLEKAVARLCIEKKLTLALMEDYSGGWLTASLTDLPECTKFFKGGLVAASDEAKVAFGVSKQTISQKGTVSAEVAKAMAESARTLLKADVGLGITGVDEVSGPMGTVYIGIADGKSGKTIEAMSRIRGKRRITTTALFELRKLLTGK